MTRLLTHPEIDWREDGTPVARAFGDVYFSVEDGLAETRAVFLKGAGLPEAWAGRSQFTVAETGFGTGLNFLALWQLWREHRPGPQARLSFVSFEAFPLRRDDAARAFASWPELQPQAEQLLARWPGPVKGVRQLSFDEDGVDLVLHLGDIAETLPQSRFRADAWFLDGFSPAKNTGMWAGGIYPLLAQRSAPGARVATFTVAGDVRRGLAASGFDVRKAEGHGRKRERLEANYPLSDSAQTQKSRPRVAILGAGIAGASLAARLKAYGAEPVVFDPAPEPASGASGNAMGLVMPRLDAGDTAEARLLIDAYLAARDMYHGRDSAETAVVRQLARNETEIARFAKLRADPPLPEDELQASEESALIHKRALIIRPRCMVAELLRDVRLELGAFPDVDLRDRTIDGKYFDVIVLACGMAISDLLPQAQLIGRLGQVEYVPDTEDISASVLASGTYAIATGRERLWGATFEPVREEGVAAISEAARLENLDGLKTLAPAWLDSVLEISSVSRASVRATTADRLPLVGAAPDAEEIAARWRCGAEREDAWPVLSGVYVAGGYGSRGLTWAPWAANLIAADICGAPLPADLPSIRAVDPVRQILRRLKRGR